MPKIIFVEPDGVRLEVEARVGLTLMEVARQHSVPGVIAQCGGACACATCHVYVDEAWLAKLPPREDMEEAMLEIAWEPRGNSRLSCQVNIAEHLDGLQVTVPSRQA